YELSLTNVTDAGTLIRRLRRTPTIINEMERMYWKKLTIDLETGLGPQPPLMDSDGNPRPPQVTLRWSDDSGKTWGNDHVLNCGLAGEFKTRVIQRRMGQSRYRVCELDMSDPVAWAIRDAYLDVQ